MGFNRLVDARLDALNPRTANRELPRGAMIARRSGARSSSSRRRVFVFAASRLNPLCFAAVAGRARDRVLVFAGQALHDVDAAVSRPGDGGRAGRRMARGRRTRRVGAVAARACDRHLGRRLRRALRVPGSRLRSRARPALDSGALRRARVACDLARACTSSRSRASSRLSFVAPLGRRLSCRRRRRRGAARRTSSRSSAPTICRRSSARSI